MYPSCFLHLPLIPSWVSTKDSSLPEGGGEISIEKLETQLNTLKTMFAEKQKLVSDLEAYGPAGKGMGRGGEKKKKLSNLPLKVAVLLRPLKRPRWWRLKKRWVTWKS